MKTEVHLIRLNSRGEITDTTACGLPRSTVATTDDARSKSRDRFRPTCQRCLEIFAVYPFEVYDAYRYNGEHAEALKKMVKAAWPNGMPR